MAELSKAARDGKLKPDQMQGGCFSISSLGGIGGTNFTPIINAPEVAILGLSRGQMKPVWDGKQFVPRLTLPLSLSYDHRVIDGAEAARFNAYLGALLADFRRIILLMSGARGGVDFACYPCPVIEPVLLTVYIACPARGGHFLCLPKKSNQKKARPWADGKVGPAQVRVLFVRP